MAVILSCIMMHGASFGSSNIEGIQVYQKNLHLSDEHKQKLANDIDRYHNAANLWDVLSEEFSLPHYEDNPYVQDQIEFFLHHQDFLAEATSRAGPYLYFILQQARKRHLPAEVVLLPMIESAYNPFAYSSAGAAGIWQMMPRTATGYGVKQDWWYDGRRDVVASTRAALDYLAYLGSFFEGNWLLAIAAYDTGEGNVLSAIRRNNREGKNTDFWSLPVAQETRIYIPRLLALAIIISHPEHYPVALPPIPNAPYLGQVDVGGQIDLQHAATLANMSLKSMKRLNPAYNHSDTNPHGPSKLILPIENVAQFTENLARSPLYKNINWLRYKIKSGDTLATISKHYNTQPAALQSANPSLASNLKPGNYLLIPRQSPEISEKLLESPDLYVSSSNLAQKKTANRSNTPILSLTNAMLKNIRGRYTLQPGDTLYMVRSGDTLEKIADRFHADTKNILAANNLSSKRHINIGDKLIIPTHANEQTPQYKLSPGDTIYMVRKNDTLDKVAKKFHTTPAAIRISNLISNEELHDGDRLVIPAGVG